MDEHSAQSVIDGMDHCGGIIRTGVRGHMIGRSSESGGRGKARCLLILCHRTRHDTTTMRI
jgi:hypothetical protein